MSAPSSPTGSSETAYFTPPEDIPPPNSFISFTRLSAEEEGQECGICTHRLNRHDRAEPYRFRVLTMNCDCVRANRIFHATCLTQELIRDHQVSDDGVAQIRCPFARHIVDAGVLQPVFETLYAPASSDGASSHSGESEKSKEELKYPELRDGVSSESSWGELPPKVQEVVEMVRHFGEPGHRRYRNQKEHEVSLMYEEFGGPREEVHGQLEPRRSWKGSYIRALSDRWGIHYHGRAPSDRSYSVLLDYEMSSARSDAADTEDHPPSYGPPPYSGYQASSERTPSNEGDSVEEIPPPATFEESYIESLTGLWNDLVVEGQQTPFSFELAEAPAEDGDEGGLGEIPGQEDPPNDP